MTYFDLEKDKNGLAIIWFDQKNSSINTISPQMIDEYAQLFDKLQADESIKAIVLCSRKKDFVVGADLKIISEIENAKDWEVVNRKGHEFLKRIENSSKPIVAALHGATKGGGLEIALACQYRLATNDKSTVFAFPEVQLGLLPAAGGTQRLPLLVGIPTALDMMLTGRNMYAEKAQKIGLVDGLVHKSKLLKAAKQQAFALVGKKIVRTSKQKWNEKLLDSNPLSRNMMFEHARKKIRQKTGGNYPAPFKIIECVEIGMRYGRNAGFEAEIQKFGDLVIHPVTKQLVNLFFTIKNKKQILTSYEVGYKGKKIDTLGIIGAGLMGLGIAQVSIQKDIKVLLKDVEENSLTKAKQQIWQDISKKKKQKALNGLDSSLMLNHVKTQLNYKHFEHVDMVIEAVFEDLELKKQIVEEVEKHTNEHCIFATNTSSLPISKIAAHAKRPEQVIGLHYFSPVPKMPLLEIIVTPKTANWVIEKALDLGIRQGKTCIVVKDGAGFYTTRILAPFLNEALLILEENGDIVQIDACAKQLGFPIGPLMLLDEVGIDVGSHIMSGDLMKLFLERGKHIKISNAPITLAENDFLGRKNKKGFYVYNKKGERKKKQINLKVYDFFGGNKDNRTHFKDKEIRRRLMMSMVNEAAHCLQEGIVENATDADLAAILGLGFPAFTGGPFHYLDNIGSKVALKRLEKLSVLYGKRFEPAEIIREYTENDNKFYV
ncbi:MAG: 3-hydroxyacyl-CoA dehydrogenase NAD-binding domain-containing protein [Chitinophagales bacterium]